MGTLQSAEVPVFEYLFHSAVETLSCYARIKINQAYDYKQSYRSMNCKLTAFRP